MAQKIPPEVIASWPKPNYVSPETRGPLIYIVNGISFSLATLAVAVRLYTRIWIRKWFGLDDFFIVLAYLLAVGVTAMLFNATSRLGWDRHIWDMEAEFITPSGKTAFIISLLWISASAFIRISILIFYYRLMRHIGIQRYRWVLHCVLFLVVGILFSYYGTLIFSCIPTRAVWASPAIESKCVDTTTAFLILSSFNTFSEFIVAMLPIPAIMYLGVLKKQRWRVLGLLSLGIFVTTVGCVRTYYVYMILTSYDTTWWIQPQWICSEFEVDTALICACAPALRPFFGRLLAKSQKATSSASSTTAATHNESASVNQSVLSNPWSNEEKLNIFGTDTHELVYRAYDLEGIETEGYGYTVHVSTDTSAATTNDPSRRSKMMTKSTRHEKASGENRREDHRTEEREHPSGLFHNMKNWWGRPGRRFSKNDNLPIEIFTRRSVQVRESFSELAQGNHGWDLRNPYPGSTLPKEDAEV